LCTEQLPPGSYPIAVKYIVSKKCSTNEGEEHVEFCWGKPRERNDLEDLGMDERIIINSNSRKLVWGLDCIDLAQDRDRWNAFVIAAIDLSVPRNSDKFLAN
jgi:hypothetical protein